MRAYPAPTCARGAATGSLVPGEDCDDGNPQDGDCYLSYSLSVTVFGMLVFGDIGSGASGRAGGERRMVVALLVAVALLTGLYRFGSTILAMILGFKMLMLIAVLVYAVGVAALLRVPSPESPR